ncbi:hypothetical protein Patl1_11417 [Pistacia atlantica]|uniref:Uncharacterized protein n=1 Tax=Pistacia atlantica TaxID=434234 RepID=A0ACC1A881_9ROSI|nr:hypothetical protein Patl1_11417 [Pistacia atlantica]
MAEEMAPATTLLVMDRVVPTPTKVAVHHVAKFVAWKETLQIGAGSAMIGNLA